MHHDPSSHQHHRCRLLEETRRPGKGKPDSAIDDALSLLLEQHRSAITDAAYAAYDQRPLAKQDEWGDLASFRSASGARWAVTTKDAFEQARLPAPRTGSLASNRVVGHPPRRFVEGKAVGRRQG
jgi:hypothetical protein